MPYGVVWQESSPKEAVMNVYLPRRAFAWPLLLGAAVLPFLPPPLNAATSLAAARPAVVTYPLGSSSGLSVFVVDTNGRVAQRIWNGARWKWQSLGSPGGAPIRTAPCVVGWNDGTGLRFNEFALRADGSLVERWYFWSRWQDWVLHGRPPAAAVGTVLESPPALVQWLSAEGAPRLNLFVVGSDQQLYERWYYGPWSWAYHGRPPGAGLVSTDTPAADVWRFDDGSLTISFFLRRMDGSVIERVWSTSQPFWRWGVSASPPGARASQPLAMTSWRRADGARELLVLVPGADKHLYLLNVVRKPSGQANWTWTDAGQPPKGVLRFAPTVTAWKGNTNRWNAFMRGFNGRLVELWKDAAGLHWSDKGRPPGGSLALAAPSVVARKSGKRQLLDVFAVGGDGRLTGYSFDGSAWKWVDHGLPPT
jgi:hypothetical protein